MSYSLIVEPEAEQDLEEIQSWYEGQRPGLAASFHLSLEEALHRITRFPFLGTEVHPEVRRTRIRRYPYSVFYYVEQTVVHVIAIYHDRRDPDLWRERFSPNGH
jgi:plasmid stabilization system protein ParE